MNFKFYLIIIFILRFCSGIQAQSPWSDLDRSLEYSGIFSTGVAVDDGYVFLVRDIDDRSTFVKLSEEGELVLKNPLSTLDTFTSGKLYSFDGQASFVGDQYPILDSFVFQNWFDNRRNVHFRIDERLQPQQVISLPFEDANQFFVSNISGNNEYLRVWEKRNLDFELLDTRIDSEPVYCFQERSMRADKEGGVYAVMISGEFQDSIVLKRIGPDLEELWSVTLADFNREAYVITANDGGAIVFNATSTGLYLSRFSAEGDIVSSTFTSLPQSQFFTGPNPTSEALHFTNYALQYEGGLQVQVHSLKGQLLLHKRLESTEMKLPAGLSTGVYLATLVDRDSQVVAQRKILVNL